MSDKRNILIQLDTDPQPSVFDRVVALDAGADELFAYGGITAENVQPHVHGAIFTRGLQDLRHTAIFVGGSDVAAGEAVLQRVAECFLGSLRVSMMLDANGANTTAAAAVLAARKHVELPRAEALVLGGTGPVGQRAAKLLAREGAQVRLASRSPERAKAAAEHISAAHPTTGGRVAPFATPDDASLRAALARVQVVIAAGAAGALLLPAAARGEATDLRVLIDLNAVPPLGIEGVEATDKAKERGGVLCYGALGVGGTKMKIHRAAVASLFTANDKRLDAEEIYELGKSL